MGGQKRDGHEAKTTKASERIKGSKTGQGTQRLGGSDLLDRRPKLTHSPDNACSCVKEIKDIAWGAVSSALPPHPKQVPPATQVRGGGKPKHRGTGKDTGDAWHRAASQFRRTAGDNRRSWGGTTLKRKYGRRGGKRRRERCTSGQSGGRHGARAG